MIWFVPDREAAIHLGFSGFRYEDGQVPSIVLSG
jgi:hypothetical protein